MVKGGTRKKPYQKMRKVKLVHKAKFISLKVIILHSIKLFCMTLFMAENAQKYVKYLPIKHSNIIFKR